MGLNNTLFPPIVDSNPAPFVFSDTSDYLKIEYPIGNYSEYQIGFKIIGPYGNEIYKDVDNAKGTLIDVSDDKDKVSLTSIKEKIPSDYIRNQYYKIQLRFKKGSGSTWDYSPWSSTILVRFIAQPQLTISATNLKKIQGNLSFNDDSEKEGFKNYQVIIKDSDKIAINTGNVVSFPFDNINFLIDYTFPIELEFNKTYYITIKYETLNGYKGICDDYLFVTPENETPDAVLITAKGIPDLGGISVHFSKKNNDTPNVYTVLRTDYTSNFGTWEILGSINLKDGKVVWIDITAESGVWYKYKCMSEAIGSTIYTGKSSAAILNLDTVFLTDEETQFLVTFNEDVSGFKYVVSESVTNTLGSKYPFVRRNANTKYRQFTLGGLISFLADDYYNVNEEYQDSIAEDIDGYVGPETSEDGTRGIVLFKDALFLTKQEHFLTMINEYNNYCKINGIDGSEDILFEKAFRDKAMEFLTNGKPKLFRSATEGNILVTLTNVSFTPNKQLGRRIYSFSATATEIAECSIESYKKYHILKEQESLVAPYILALYGDSVDTSEEILTLDSRSINSGEKAIIFFQIDDKEV